MCKGYQLLCFRHKPTIDCPELEKKILPWVCYYIIVNYGRFKPSSKASGIGHFQRQETKLIESFILSIMAVSTFLYSYVPSDLALDFRDVQHTASTDLSLNILT